MGPSGRGLYNDVSVFVKDLNFWSTNFMFIRQSWSEAGCSVISKVYPRVYILGTPSGVT